MKLTIIVDDSAVYVDGISYVVNTSECNIPSNVWALQWKNTSGWVEFQENDDGTKPQNETITELPTWANACIAKWNEAKVAEETARALALASDSQKANA